MRRPLTFAGGDETEGEGAGFFVDHGVNDDFFEGEVRMRLGTNPDHFSEASEWDSFFRVIERVRANENRLADRI